MDSSFNSSSATNDVTKGQANLFRVRLSANLMNLLSVFMLISILLPTSSSEFQAELFPLLYRIILTVVFFMCGIMLLQRREFARHLFLILFPFALVAIAAAYPLTLWSNDIPLTLMGFLLYAPLAFSLTRAKAIMSFRSTPCGWIGRGGIDVIIGFILALIYSMALPELTKTLNLDSDTHMVYSATYLVLLVNFAAGVVAVGIPTRFVINGRKKVVASDKVGAILSFALILLMILFRVYRPDLSNINGLANLTNLKLTGDCKIIKFNVSGLDEQEATWVIEHQNANVLAMLNDMGYHQVSLQNFQTPDIGYASWLYNDAMHYPFFSDSSKVTILVGGRAAPQVLATKWYHFVVLSKDGRYSMHRVYLWAKP